MGDLIYTYTMLFLTDTRLYPLIFSRLHPPTRYLTLLSYSFTKSSLTVWLTYYVDPLTLPPSPRIIYIKNALVKKNPYLVDSFSLFFFFFLEFIGIIMFPCQSCVLVFFSSRGDRRLTALIASCVTLLIYQ